MNEDSSIIRLRQPNAIDDPLTALLRSGARQLLEQAIEAEIVAFLASSEDLKLADGRDRLVRHGHGPERVIQTGPVEVQRVRIRDRAPGPAAEWIRFSSALLPRRARRTTSLDALLPILYLRGVSAGDFQHHDAANPRLRRTVISRRVSSAGNNAD
jgi:putative transposase